MQAWKLQGLQVFTETVAWAEQICVIRQTQDNAILESFIWVWAGKYGLFLKGLELEVISIIVTLAHDYGKNYS